MFALKPVRILRHFERRPIPPLYRRSPRWICHATRPPSLTQLRHPQAPVSAFPRTKAAMSSNGATEGGDATTAEEVFTYDGKDYRAVREGMASILVPTSAVKQQKGKAEEVQQVFYNPIQQFNRDLSVLAIRAHGEEMLAKKAHPAVKRKDKKRQRPQGDDEADERPAKVQVSEGSDGAVASAVSAPADEPVTTAEDKEQAQAQDETPAVSKTSFTILDALSASGLRALRYSHELPFVTSVTANDLTKSATESIKLNAKHNNLEDKIEVTHDDAIAHMYRRIAEDLSNRDSRGRPSKRNKYNVIDLDPYGTAAPFLDAAVQSVRDDGGLLCVTCTDASHWAGHCYAEKSFSLYGGSPIRGQHTHEVGLRLILHAIASAAARHNLHIEPLLSLSIDFYARVFVRVRQSSLGVSFLGGKTMILYQCSGCGAYETAPFVRTRPAPKKKDGYFYKHGLAHGPPTGEKCRHCDSTQHIAGPVYGGPIHDPDFIERILSLLPDADSEVYGTIPRIEGMLTTALEEYLPGPEPQEALDPKETEMAKVDHYPFFVIPSALAGILNAQSIPEAMFRGALIHLGYRVTRSHCKPGSIKTDAPWDTMWFVMREWIRQKHPVKTEKMKPGTPAYNLLGLGDKDAQKANKTEIQSVEDRPRDERGEYQQEASGSEDRTLAEEELRRTLVFDDALAKLGKVREAKKLVRYQTNPRENWGPLTKARGR